MRDLSVIVATHNRAGVLRSTLNAMSNLSTDGVDAQWIIVDNNSTDSTSSTIQEFEHILPLRHLFEARPGKNCALNLALRQPDLGEIVVFTDDDVIPQPDWLVCIMDYSRRWQEFSVFGGRVIPCLPQDFEIPVWAHSKWIRRWGFAEHNRGDQAKIYEGFDHPYGPNFWVRRTALRHGRRFDETVGPRPNDRIMGSEAGFLIGLVSDGYPILYCPGAVVEHRISASQLSEQAITKRAFRRGRATPRLEEYHRNGKPAERSPSLLRRWHQSYLLAHYGVLYFLGGLVYRGMRRTESRCFSMMRLGGAYERLRMLSRSSSRRSNQ